MALLLANTEMKTDQNVVKGKKVSIFPLFSATEGWKLFKLLNNVEANKTRITVNVAKVGSFKTRVTISSSVGEETNLWVLLDRGDFHQKMKSMEDIKKGENLTVTLERQ